MALDDFGISFFPGAEQQDRAAELSTAQLDDVVQLLALRLPRLLGAKPIAPGELLRSPGSAGSPIPAIPATIFNRFLTPGGHAPMPSGGGPGTSPLDDLIAQFVPSGSGIGTQAPRVIPSIAPPPTQPPTTTPISTAPSRILPIEPGESVGFAPTAAPRRRGKYDPSEGYYPGPPRY